jgi:hypothetical protein
MVITLAPMAEWRLYKIALTGHKVASRPPRPHPRVSAGIFDLSKREAAEAANVRACRLAGAISRMSATFQQGLLALQRKRTRGNQHVTVKHIHQQVNVTQGGQAVVAGDKVTSRTRGRHARARTD